MLFQGTNTVSPYASSFLTGVYLLVIMLLPGLTPLWAQSALIIDHSCCDLDKIPDSWITKAKNDFRVGYGHTSHGSQLVSGMETFRGSPGDLYYYSYSSWGLVPGIFLNDYWGNAEGGSDLGHNGDLAWRDATVTLLNNGSNDRNVVLWSWCGGCSDNTEQGITTYLNAMDQLESQYPGVIFVYMTGHLDGTGVSGNLNIRNEQIRAYCQANNKVLFDFADIESYDPDGNYYLDLQATDNCDYYTKANWAQEWCAANNGSDLCLSCSCAHSQPLNCNLKGRAFWWMMARLAGWSGQSQASVPTLSGVGLVILFTLFSSVLVVVRKSTHRKKRVSVTGSRAHDRA